MPEGTFYEDDEPLEKLRAALRTGRPVVTVEPPSMPFGFTVTSGPVVSQQVPVAHGLDDRPPATGYPRILTTRLVPATQ
jgi:hypothetical protein